MESIILVYNKYFYNLIEDILNVSPQLSNEITNACKIKTPNSIKHITRFSNQLSGSTLSDLVDADIVVDLPECVSHIELLNGVSIGTIYKSIADSSKPQFVKYVYILSLFANLWSLKIDDDDKLELFNLYISLIKNVATIDSDDLKSLYDTSVKKTFMKLKDLEQITTDRSENDIDSTTESILSNNNMCNLAMEICKDLKLDQENDGEMDMKSFIESGTLGKVFDSVTSKVHSKLQSGELKHKDLIDDACKLISGLLPSTKSDNTGCPNELQKMLNNPMLKSMMGNMFGSTGKATTPHDASARREALRRKFKKREDKD